MKRKRVALVLAGGAARGAYEVGVVQYVFESVAASLGRPLRFDIFCGTSVGALNACGLAAWAHEGKASVARMLDVWHALKLETLLRTDVLSLFGALRLRSTDVPPREAGVLDAKGIEAVFHCSIPFERIDENLAAGLRGDAPAQRCAGEDGEGDAHVQFPNGSGACEARGVFHESRICLAASRGWPRSSGERDRI